MLPKCGNEEALLWPIQNRGAFGGRKGELTLSGLGLDYIHLGETHWLAHTMMITHTVITHNGKKMTEAPILNALPPEKTLLNTVGLTFEKTFVRLHSYIAVLGRLAWE